jgi:hypothetical protein
MVAMAVALPVGRTLQRRLFMMAFAQALVLDFTLQGHVERGQTFVAPSTALGSIWQIVYVIDHNAPKDNVRALVPSAEDLKGPGAPQGPNRRPPMAQDVRTCTASLPRILPAPEMPVMAFPRGTPCPGKAAA